MPRKRQAELPSRKQIIDFISTSGQPAGKREIARAFNLSGSDKIALKKLLNDMTDEGLIEGSKGRAFNKVGGVPKVTVLKVVGVDDSGIVSAVPEEWQAETPPPKIRILERGRKGALGIGDRVLARTEERGQGFVAHPLKKLARQAELVLGRGPQGGRPPLAVPGRQARAPRAAAHRPRRCPGRRPGAVRGRRPAAAGNGSMRCSATRSRRAASA